MIDGIRYSAEIADIAYARLVEKLVGIAGSIKQTTSRDIAVAIADAWTIIDSAHRFYDLITHLPGLNQGKWCKLLQIRIKDELDLRDCVQHQIDRVDNLITEKGQIWGYLSMAEVADGKYTGKWVMICPGSEYVGDKFFFIGPMTLPFRVPPGRVRLNAFGRKVYLGRTIEALAAAVSELASQLEAANIRPIGSPASDRREADSVVAGWLEIGVSMPPPKNNSSLGDLDDS